MLENKKMPIIVEGDHDVNALRKIGFSGEIIKLNQGISIETFCSKISSEYKQVLLLTDFDKKGIELESKIARFLESYGCNANLRLWLFVKKSFKIKSVEDLPWLVQETL